jgi:antitoxin (DNA-binding transcriptional repressor) of toxin-antitoxin stability system
LPACTHKLEVGVKEFKNRTTQIIRNIREKGTEYVITVEKFPVAVIMSLKNHSLVGKQSKRAEVLKSIESLSKDNAKDWDNKMNAAEAVAELRRS